jgi:multicomponent Na+:H+ antiporter subunit D
VARTSNGFRACWLRKLGHVIDGLYHSYGPEGRMARVWPTGAMVMWIAIVLGMTLVVSFAS